MAELDRCIRDRHHSCESSFIKDCWDKLGAKDYNKVVVWHGMDSNSLLLLYFICAVMPDEIEIFHFNHCNWSYLNLTDFMPILLGSPIYERKLSAYNRNKFKRIYWSLNETEGIPKVAQGYQIKCKSRDYVKSLLLRNIKDKPISFSKLISYTCQHQPKGCHFSPSYLDYMLFELVESGDVCPTGIQRSPKSPYSLRIGIYVDRNYYYKGELVNDWYDFKVRKNR